MKFIQVIAEYFVQTYLESSSIMGRIEVCLFNLMYELTVAMSSVRCHYSREPPLTLP